MIHTEWHLTPPFYPCQPAMLTEKREAQNKLLREGEVSSGSRFPWDLVLSHRRESINLHSPNFKKPKCLRRANMHMYKHNFYLFPDSPQHSMSTTHTHTCQKNNPLGHIISWQAVFLFCVCVHAGLALPSLGKTNGQTNTWLTQVPWRKMMASVFTYKLHPAGTATFTAQSCQFAGICGNLLNSPYS